MTRQELPCACRKQDIYKIFNTFSEKYLREIINEVIASTRKIDLQAAKWTKTLRKDEVSKVLIEIGENDTILA